VTEGLRTKWQPSADDLSKCRQFGSTIGKAVKQNG